jgi:hypothetical protein
MQLAGIGVPGHLVIARVIELMSKLDGRRVLEEAGAAAASYRTVLGRLRVYAKAEWRRRMSGMFAGPRSRLRTAQSRPQSASDG